MISSCFSYDNFVSTSIYHDYTWLNVYNKNNTKFMLNYYTFLLTLLIALTFSQIVASFIVLCRKMTTEYTTVQNLTDQTRNWVLKLNLLEKYHPRTFRNNQNKISTPTIYWQRSITQKTPNISVSSYI